MRKAPAISTAVYSTMCTMRLRRSSCSNWRNRFDELSPFSFISTALQVLLWFSSEYVCCLRDRPRGQKGWECRSFSAKLAELKWFKAIPMAEPVTNQMSYGNSEGEICSRFWVSTYPFFSTELFIVPALKGQEGSVPGVTSLILYDADGAVANEVKLQFPSGVVGFVDLELLLGSCKLEGGMKHGQLVLRSPAGTKHLCRIANANRSWGLGEPQEVTVQRAAFLPVGFSEESASFATFVNYAGDEAKVRCRLYAGSKNAEIEISIPGNGSRILSLEAEFAEYTELAEGEKRHAYLRIAGRSEGVVGVQLLEKYATAGGEEYRTIC